MTDLLTRTLEAHGGLKRWNELTIVAASLSVGGALWKLKGRANEPMPMEISGQLHSQRMTTTLIESDKTLVFTPELVKVKSSSGTKIARTDELRNTFAGQTVESTWDDLHFAYFNSYALWNYLTIPFLYTTPGFTTWELDTWEEQEEQWERLNVIYPPSITTHGCEQTSYFGPEGLLRRHQYTVDALGGARGVNYAYEYRDVGGLMVPMKRRVYAYDEKGRKVPEPVLVSIDINEISFS
jgi:hypothetical protein